MSLVQTYNQAIIELKKYNNFILNRHLENKKIYRPLYNKFYDLEIFKKLYEYMCHHKQILITDDFLKFSGFTLKFEKKKCVDFLKKNKIRYGVIDYKNKNKKYFKETKEYFQKINEGLNLKCWYTVYISGIKKFLIKINNSRSLYVLKNYNQMKTMLNLYNNYIKKNTYNN